MYNIYIEHKKNFLENEFDALYVDKSKIRNIFSYNLWNTINDNQSDNNDLNGDFVEVFIKNEYYGLYVLKNKVNKEIDDMTDKAVLKDLKNIKEAEVVENKKTGTKITRISAKDTKKKRRK